MGVKENLAAAVRRSRPTRRRFAPAAKPPAIRDSTSEASSHGPGFNPPALARTQTSHTEDLRQPAGDGAAGARRRSAVASPLERFVISRYAAVPVLPPISPA